MSYSSIKKKTGICQGHFCQGNGNEVILSHAKKKLCQRCHKHERAQVYQERQRSKPRKEQKAIPKRTKKRAKQEKVYSTVRKVYLENHSICQVTDCNNKSTEIHHKKGRDGDLLTDIKIFWNEKALGVFTELIDSDNKFSKYSESFLVPEDLEVCRVDVPF